MLHVPHNFVMYDVNLCCDATLKILNNYNYVCLLSYNNYNSSKKN